MASLADRERLERTFKVNIIGMFSLAQKAVQHMVDTKGGGNIINIASIQAYKPSPPILDYSCTKVCYANPAEFAKNNEAAFINTTDGSLEEIDGLGICLLML